MGATTLATIIAMVAAKILSAYWGRTDVTDAARWRIYQEMQVANDRAGVWKNRAWGDPLRAAQLGLLPDAQGLRLDRTDDPAQGGPDPRPVPPGGSGR